MCFTRHRVYAATPSVVSSARDFTSAFLVAVLEPKGWTVADDATLVVSELMTACLEAGATRVDVQLDLHYDTVRVEVVGDQAGGQATIAALGEARARVLDALTLRVETESADGWTRGVASLPCDPEFTGRLACEHRPHRVTA